MFSEMAMKNKEEEFNKIIAELNINNASLQEKLRKEELMKLVRLLFILSFLSYACCCFIFSI